MKQLTKTCLCSTKLKAHLFRKINEINQPCFRYASNNQGFVKQKIKLNGDSFCDQNALILNTHTCIEKKPSNFFCNPNSQLMKKNEGSCCDNFV